MRFAIGLDPFTGTPMCATRPVLGLVCSDAVWWLLETILVLGALWPRVRPAKRTTVLWIVLVWLFATAARFTPLIVAATLR